MIKNLIHDKENIVTIPETMNCLEAVQLLEAHSLRNAPIVDATKSLYRGNIYRYHIYKYKFHNPEADMSKINVTHFMKNSTKVINENASIYHLIFAINDLPYIAVLNNQSSFVGIIKHSTLMHYLKQAWNTGRTGYLIAIHTRGVKGELQKISRIINKQSDINLAITFEKTTLDTETYLLLGLPDHLDQTVVNSLARDLRRRKYECITYVV